jgi:heptosyltransferase-2
VIDQAHSQHEARWATLFGDATLAADFAQWLASFDTVVSYWPDPERELGRRFPLRDGQRFISAPAMPICAPAAAHYCAPLRVLGIEPRENYFPLAPLPRTPFAASQQGASCSHVVRNLGKPDNISVSRGNIIAVHPGSGSLRKNWPAENWLALIRWLPSPVSLVLGEAESERWSATVPSRRPVGRADREGTSDGQPSDALGQMLRLVNRPLEELVAHFARCRLFLGHDSGVSHLAAASGVRCVLLFGPTDPAVWAPPTPGVQVVRHHFDLSTLSLDVVQRAVAEALADRT